MPAVKSRLESVNLTMQEVRRQWCCADEVPVLCASLAVPQCGKLQTGAVARRLDRYYRQCMRAFLSYCQRYLYPQALSAFDRARQISAPLPCAEARLECTVTCNQDGVLSLYLDCTEWAGTPEALTLRRADTWDLSTGAPICARDCFPPGVRPRRRCLDAARAQCAAQESAGKAVYTGHLSARLRRYLNLRNFYLSERGFHFFYQPCCIAPASAGCPAFFLPFSNETGPIWPLNPCQNLAK